MSIALLLTALGLGLRHGIDWDHIAAIADISSSAENRKRGFALSMTYAIGHGIVVFVLGVLAIVFGLAIPDGVDVWMGRIVGATLIFLGGWILIELIRKGRDFRLRSRWMLVIDGTFAGMRRVRDGLSGRVIEVEHEHHHDHHDADHATVVAHDHAHVAATANVEPALVGATGSALHSHSHGHSHRHSHKLALPDSPSASYGHRTATGIGMLHGVGIESPTQIAIFVASSAAAGFLFGISLLAAWVVGLIVANAGLALLAGAGVLNAERSFPIYATLAVIVGVLSVVLGTLYLFDLDILPALN